MLNRKYIDWSIGRAGLFFLLMTVLPACSTFPQLVRHSDPLTPEQHLQLGAAYETQGLKENAGQQYASALHGDKKNIPALIAIGNLAFERGELKKAEACYRRVLRLDPNHAGANNNLAMVFLSRGKDLDKAERHAQMALKQEGPLRPYVLDTLASIYIQQDRRSEAWKILDEADAAAPSDNQVLRDQIAKTRERLEAL